MSQESGLVSLSAHQGHIWKDQLERNSQQPLMDKSQHQTTVTVQVQTTIPMSQDPTTTRQHKITLRTLTTHLIFQQILAAIKLTSTQVEIIPSIQVIRISSQTW